MKDSHAKVRSVLFCSVLFCSQVICADVFKQIEEYGVSDLEGVTFGIDLGYSHSCLKNEQYAQEFFLVKENKTLFINTSEIIKQKRCSTDISINIGYSCFFDRSWYLGAAGEFSFGGNTKKFVILDEDFPTKSKISGFSSAIKLKSGYYFKDLNTVIYGIAGLKWRNVEMQYNYDNKAVSATGSKAKLSTPLYTVGVGIESPIYKKLSISAEYEYTWRNSKDTSKLKPNNIPVCFYIKQRMREHGLKVGIKCHI